MSYHVNAARSDGAISLPVLSLEDARSQANEFKARGYDNIVIINAGTGMPVSIKAAFSKQENQSQDNHG